MTGGIKSTPINSMESVTGLESLEDRRKKKIVCQYTKFQHLANHPMCKLITNNPRKRLKRTNFTASAQQIHKSLELPDLRPDTPLQSSIDWPPWNQQNQIEIVKDIDGVTSKKSMIKRELHCLTQNMLDKKYTSNYWIRAFTDGSASEAVRDGGGGVYIEWPDNSSSKISIPTGKYSTNYKAEAEALQEAAKVLVNSEATHHARVVLLTDAGSVLDALDSTKCPEVNALAQAITTLSLTASKLVLQ
ncbi:reverse transcriptase [Elysia marginata]|uniref:Reverse transcriptase n=1 Tax=Elysia marginata TaxID=1093978 RepID=A0AAV4J9H1_9GAST|nr:reverse transcriptase [Elysia marginata]